MTAVVAIAQRGVRGFCVVVDGQRLPLLQVTACRRPPVVLVARQGGNLGHGLETNDALDCQVRLVAALSPGWLVQDIKPEE